MMSLVDYIKQTTESLVSYQELVLEEYEFLNSINIFHPIVENSNSLYRGQYELAEFLCMQLLLKHSDSCSIIYKKEDLTKFDNIFFDEVKVEYRPTIHLGGYEYKDDIIHITINSKDVKKYESILSTIGHELKHAWQDFKQDYNENSPSKISKTKQYQDITRKLTNKDINVMGAASYAYHCYTMEQDAFASEFAIALKLELKKHKPKDIHECIKLAGTIDVFAELARYRDIYNILSSHNSIGNLTKDDLLNAMHEIKNKRYTWKQFRNVYIRKIEKLFKKLCHLISVLYFEMEEV